MSSALLLAPAVLLSLDVTGSDNMLLLNSLLLCTDIVDLRTTADGDDIHNRRHVEDCEGSLPREVLSFSQIFLIGQFVW
jgi:hypothetical protein